MWEVMQVLTEDTELPIINNNKPITNYHLLLDILIEKVIKATRTLVILVIFMTAMPLSSDAATAAENLRCRQQKCSILLLSAFSAA